METDLFSQVCSLENLELAYEKAIKGKTLKKYVIEFEKHLKENILQLQIELVNKSYEPRK